VVDPLAVRERALHFRGVGAGVHRGAEGELVTGMAAEEHGGPAARGHHLQEAAPDAGGGADLERVEAGLKHDRTHREGRRSGKVREGRVRVANARRIESRKVRARVLDQVAGERMD